jgi:hypothetical protein
VVRGIESAKTKLAMAAKHLKSIKRSIAKYSAGRPYKIQITKAKGKNTRKLTIPKAPPREISVLAGEVIYQIRSALDHLAFDLVKRNLRKIILPPKWDRRTEFPIWVSIPAKGNPPVSQKPPLPYNVFCKTLPGISIPAFTFIESVQPYYRKGEINNSLRLLAELSNIDKHRYLNVVGARVGDSPTSRFRSGLSITGFQALDRGAKLPSVTGRNQSDRPAYVHRRFRTFVTFKERAALGDATTLAVDYLLEFILKQIQTIVIPAFEKLM